MNFKVKLNWLIKLHRFIIGLLLSCSRLTNKVCLAELKVTLRTNVVGTYIGAFIFVLLFLIIISIKYKFVRNPTLCMAQHAPGQILQRFTQLRRKGHLLLTRTHLFGTKEGNVF